MNKDSNLPTFYFGDPTRIEQILLNLVNNAVKFTKDGDVTLSVRYIANEKDSYYIEFSVKDTGIGMTTEQIGQLFVHLVRQIPVLIDNLVEQVLGCQL